jgi:hypothetical protein
MGGAHAWAACDSGCPASFGACSLGPVTPAAPSESAPGVAVTPRFVARTREPLSALFDSLKHLALDASDPGSMTSIAILSFERDRRRGAFSEARGRHGRHCACRAREAARPSHRYKRRRARHPSARARATRPTLERRSLWRGYSPWSRSRAARRPATSRSPRPRSPPHVSTRPRSSSRERTIATDRPSTTEMTRLRAQPMLRAYMAAGRPWGCDPASVSLDSTDWKAISQAS